MRVRSLVALALPLMMAVLVSSFASLSVHAQDPLKVAPAMYKLLFENDRVRVMEVTFKPGEKIAAHSHPDHFVYVVTGGKLKITAGGKDTEADLTPGQVLWIPAETHSAVNTGSTELRAVVTELKEPVPGGTAPPKATK